jgi:hypothetical protein
VRKIRRYYTKPLLFLPWRRITPDKWATLRRRIMQRKARGLFLVPLVLLFNTSAWAIPLTGYLEGTASNGWLGAFAVQLTDGSIVTGVDQMSGFPDHGFQSLRLVTEGCTVSLGCVAVTNVTTATVMTMTFLGLGLGGSANLGSLGTVSWSPQILELFLGDPSPTAAVLAKATGTLGGTTLTPSTFSFGFNSTLTASFVSVAGGQALNSLRLDFTDGIAPPTSRNWISGCCFVNNGVPVALGTQLAVPEPSPLLQLSLSMAGLLWWPWKRIDGQ